MNGHCKVDGAVQGRLMKSARFIMEYCHHIVRDLAAENCLYNCILVIVFLQPGEEGCGEAVSAEDRVDAAGHRLVTVTARVRLIRSSLSLHSGFTFLPTTKELVQHFPPFLSRPEQVQDL